jgi:hypothetical protein
MREIDSRNIIKTRNNAGMVGKEGSKCKSSRGGG